MYARHESARVRPNAGGYLVLVLVAAVVVTACVTTSCTNLAASPTTAPAPVSQHHDGGTAHDAHRRCGSEQHRHPAQWWGVPDAAARYLPPRFRGWAADARRALLTGGHERGGHPGHDSPNDLHVRVDRDRAATRGDHRRHQSPIRSCLRYSGGHDGRAGPQNGARTRGRSGNAGDVANFWFEPGPISNLKDTVERVLNHATCAA